MHYVQKSSAICRLKLAGEPDDNTRSLVRAWCAGDPEAFSELLIKHEKLMRRVAVITAGALAARDGMLIDDILQEACIRLLDALQHYKGECEPGTFIAGVVGRLFWNFISLYKGKII